MGTLVGVLGLDFSATGEWMDWLADGVGVCMGLVCWCVGTWWHERRVGK